MGIKSYSERLWWANEESQKILNKGYLLKGETTQTAIRRIVEASLKNTNRLDLLEDVIEIIERGWMSLSSPIWANMGTTRGLPISCVTGDTWINTSDGGKQAKDIEIGDLVLTHKNRFRPVTDVMPTKDRGDIYKLKVGTRLTNLYVTGNHQILTNLGWIRVDELDIDKHLVAVNGEIKHSGKDYTIDMKEFVNYQYILEDGLIKKKVETENKKTKKKNFSDTHVTYYSKPKEFVDIDNDLAWALGVWFAEGSISTNNKKEPNGIRITLNDKDEKEIGEKWLSIMSSKFNINGSSYQSEVVRNDKSNSWLNVNVNSKVIGNLFNSFGKGCKEKTLPEWILNLPVGKLKAFLDGILLGDGTNTGGRGIKLTLSNPKLVLQIYNIGLKLGHDMSLQMQEKARKLSTTAYVYSLVFRDYRNSISKNQVNAGVKFSDGLVYCPIKELELTEKIEDVYDFTVEEDHSFSCAGVVVHNCFNTHVPDSIEGITKKLSEVILQTKFGGGTSGYIGELRERGAEITDNGKSSGSVSFLELFNSAMNVVSQGS